MNDSCRFLFLASLCIVFSCCQAVWAQPFIGDGFRLQRDENGGVIAAEYLDHRAIDFLIKRDRADWRNLVPVDHLTAYPTIEKVSYSYGFHVTAEHLARFASLPNLKDIELGFVGMSSEYVTIEGDMKLLSELRNLERVHLCKEDMSDRDLEFVGSLKKLKHLEFNANTVQEDGSSRNEVHGCTDQCADHLNQATQLEILWIHDATNLSDAFVEKLTEGVTKLQEFDVASPLFTDRSVWLLAERCTKLQSIVLASDRVTDAGVEHLNKLQELRSVQIGSKSLTRKCIASITNHKKLQYLELTISRIEDDDARGLAELSELELLCMRETALTDTQFAEFRDHPSLKSAFLNGSKLSNEETLNTIAGIPSLKHLEIGGNATLQRQVNEALARRAN